jgi:hypothetical protein
MNEVRERLSHVAPNDAYRALRSVEAAEGRLELITSARCRSFLDAWQDDLDGWRRRFSRLTPVANEREAFDYLGITTWRALEFANPDRPMNLSAGRESLRRSAAEGGSPPRPHQALAARR